MPDSFAHSVFTFEVIELNKVSEKLHKLLKTFKANQSEEYNFNQPTSTSSFNKNVEHNYNSIRVILSLIPNYINRKKNKKYGSTSKLTC